jgi:hypothetical protein
MCTKLENNHERVCVKPLKLLRGGGDDNNHNNNQAFRILLNLICKTKNLSLKL